MEAIIKAASQKNYITQYKQDVFVPESSSSQRTNKLERVLVVAAKQISLFYFACVVIKKPLLIFKTFRHLFKNCTSKLGGKQINKMYKSGRKILLNNLYNPG